MEILKFKLIFYAKTRLGWFRFFTEIRSRVTRTWVTRWGEEGGPASRMEEDG